MGRMTYTIYEMDNNIHVWNHQPVIKYCNKLMSIVKMTISLIHSHRSFRASQKRRLCITISYDFHHYISPSGVRPSHQASGFQHIAQSPSFLSIHFWQLLQICWLQQALQPDTGPEWPLVPARNVSNDEKTNGFWSALFYPRIFQQRSGGFVWKRSERLWAHCSVDLIGINMDQFAMDWNK